jgi:hypothetical protein
MKVVPVGGEHTSPAVQVYAQDKITENGRYKRSDFEYPLNEKREIHSFWMCKKA